jgi:hypothetical protein
MGKSHHPTRAARPALGLGQPREAGGGRCDTGGSRIKGGGAIERGAGQGG